MLSLLSHMKYKFLIVLKTSFLDVHGRGCDFSKGVSSLSLVCLADNVDSLEDDDDCLDDVLLDYESEFWSDGIEITSSVAQTLQKWWKL